MKAWFYSILFFSTMVFAQEQNQSINLKTVVMGASQALKQTNKSTTAPVGSCSATMHISKDDCGSRVPASYWKEFIFNFNSVASDDSLTQASKMNDFINSISILSDEAKDEMKKVFLKIKQDEMNFKSISIYSDFLKNKNEVEFKKKLKDIGFSNEEIEKAKQNFESSPIGKNLKQVSDYGIFFDVNKGWTSSTTTPEKGYLSPRAINENSELRTSLTELFGKEKIENLINPKRTDAVNIGNIIFTPLNKDNHFATYSKEEWENKAKIYLNIYYREIKDASEAIPKLGSMWDGWKLHSSRSHHKLVQDQYDRFNLASVEVDALRSLGFPSSDTLQLDQQIVRMSQASADTVNDVYQSAEGLRKKLYGVAAGAAFAATPWGQAFLLENLSGSMGYLAIAGLTLPYVQNAVNTGIQVTSYGGSFWCQYTKTLANAVTDSALNTITFNVIPIPSGGNTIRSLESLLKIGKQALRFIAEGKNGWEIGGKAYDCYGAAQLFKDAEEEVNFYSEIGDFKAIDELKLQAEETHQQMLKTCSDLAFSGIKLGIASLDTKIKNEKNRKADEDFKKKMAAADPMKPKIVEHRSIQSPTIKEGKTIYKSSNGSSYEVKIIPNSDGTNKVFFLSGDRVNKMGTMSSENLNELRSNGRLLTVILEN